MSLFLFGLDSFRYGFLLWLGVFLKFFGKGFYPVVFHIPSYWPDNDGEWCPWLFLLNGSLLQFGICSGMPGSLIIDPYEFQFAMACIHYAGLSVAGVLDNVLNSLKSAVGLSFWARSFSFHACQLKKR